VRSLACGCRALSVLAWSYYFSPTFSVGDEDSTLDNARFVASMMLPTLNVRGEDHLPVLELLKYRGLLRLKVGAMGKTAALFFGAAVAECDCLVRLSDGLTIKSLRPLRERDKLELNVKCIIDLAVLLGALALNTQLTELVLHGPALGAQASALICDVIGPCSSLARLDLRGVWIPSSGNARLGPEFVGGAREVATRLAATESLTKVNLDGCPLPVQMLKGTDPVKALDLSGVGLQLASVIVIGSLVGINTSLTSLYLSRNHIGAAGAQPLADALQVNSTLRSLSLSDNDLCDEGVEALSIGLKESTSLATLDLSNRVRSSLKFGLKGAAALASAIGESSSLTSLDLGGNWLRDEGTAVVTTALRDNSSCQLKELRIHNNGIASAGTMSVAAYVAASTSLEDLDVSSNNLAGKSGLVRAAELQAGGQAGGQGATFHVGDQVTYQGREMSIATVDRYGGIEMIDLSGIRALADSLAANSSLRQLDVSGLPLDCGGVGVLQLLKDAVNGREGFALIAHT